MVTSCFKAVRYILKLISTISINENETKYIKRYVGSAHYNETFSF